MTNRACTNYTVMSALHDHVQFMSLLHSCVRHYPRLGSTNGRFGGHESRGGPGLRSCHSTHGPSDLRCFCPSSGYHRLASNLEAADVVRSFWTPTWDAWASEELQDFPESMYFRRKFCPPSRRLNSASSDSLSPWDPASFCWIFSSAGLRRCPELPHPKVC